MSTVEASIRAKLQEGLQPSRLEVRNVSHQHAGHAGSPGTGESHFEVEVVSELFSTMNRVQRQRRVYQLLAAEMAGPVHALALVTKAPGE